MGDLYKCKKCGQLCYGVAQAEVDGNLAMEILNQINRDGYIEAEGSIPFLDSDFSKFMIKRSLPGGVRYDADAGFSIVMENMRQDKVVIGSKITEDGYSYLRCPICQSEEFFSELGSLPTTFVDGKWDNFVESDHTWYLLSEGNGGRGSFTELERRELVNYIGKEDRQDAQKLYNELIQECNASVVKKTNGFAQTRDVELTPFFRALMNVKADIQLLENRLFELVLKQLPVERAFVNSICRSEETIVNEIDKEKHQIAVQIAMLEKELEFHQRGDWREVNNIIMPQEPVKPVLEKPQEPIYRQAGLFNRKEVQEENDALRAAYTAKVDEYNRRGREYSEQLKKYQEDKAYYDRRKAEILYQEKTAWENDPDNVVKQKRMNELKARDDELNEMLKNPLEFAQRMLEHSGPAKVKNMVDAEIDRNAATLRKAYQIESDLQTILFVLPKYLDIVSVSKIYEYFVTGKVNSLTGAQGAYHLYDSEMRYNRTALLNVSKNTANLLSKEYTVYKALASVFQSLNEIGQMTEDAIDELRNSNETNAYEEYLRCIDLYYSLIQEDLRVCDEYAQKEIEENTPKQPEPEVTEEPAAEEAAPGEASEAQGEPTAEPEDKSSAEEEKPEEEKAEEEPAEESPKTSDELTSDEKPSDENTSDEKTSDEETVEEVTEDAKEDINEALAEVQPEEPASATEEISPAEPSDEPAEPTPEEPEVTEPKEEILSEPSDEVSEPVSEEPVQQEEIRTELPDASEIPAEEPKPLEQSEAVQEEPAPVSEAESVELPEETEVFGQRNEAE